MPRKDSTVVFTAIAANFSVMCAKFIAGAISGSSSLFAEGLHSLSETADGVMHLIGERLAQRPPDERHPFGHGKELYFWTLVVALSIFAIGGCASILKGIDRIISADPVEHFALTITVLVIALFVQGASVTYAWIQFLKHQRGHKSPNEITKAGRPIKKETTKFVVVFEDSAGVLGVVIAIVATSLAYFLELPWIDGIGAILIGILLGIVGVRLAIEIRKLLIGERVALDEMESLQKILNAEPSIASVGRLRTMHFGPETVVLAANVHFDRSLSSTDVADASKRVVREIQAKHPEVRYVFLHPTIEYHGDQTENR